MVTVGSAVESVGWEGPVRHDAQRGEKVRERLLGEMSGVRGSLDEKKR